MKRFLLFGLLVAIMLVGCDLFPSIGFDDVKGEWDFSDVKVNDISYENVHLSILEGHEEGYTVGVDLHLGDELFYYGDGNMDGNKYTGYYKIGGDTTEASYQITVVFSLKDDRLKAIFDGKGPLDGLILEHGTRSD